MTPTARRCRAAVAAATLITLHAAAGAVVVLGPQLPDTTTTARGADAEFYRIANDWHGSTVLWDEQQRRFGSGVPIGTLPWGTGLWGADDWRTVQAAARGTGASGAPAVVQRFEGVTPLIDHGNSRYNECHSATWGAALLVPFFVDAPQGGDCGDPEAGDPAQQNWTAHFRGFIRIVDPGLYNFGVLYDDGFFFRLVGEGGSEVGIDRDFLNPRDRLGFAEDLQLSSGLYGFELGMWNRLGAGVVDLRWKREGTDWELVPTESLVPASRIAEPGSLALWVAAIGVLGWFARRLQRAA